MMIMHAVFKICISVKERYQYSIPPSSMNCLGFIRVDETTGPKLAGLGFHLCIRWNSMNYLNASKSENDWKLLQLKNCWSRREPVKDCRPRTSQLPMLCWGQCLAGVCYLRINSTLQVRCGLSKVQPEQVQESLLLITTNQVLITTITASSTWTAYQYSTAPFKCWCQHAELRILCRAAINLKQLSVTVPVWRNFQANGEPIESSTVQHYPR